MLISRSRAILSGIAAIAVVITIEAFNRFVCSDSDFSSFMATLPIFVLIPLLPAIISLVTANPLRAVGACLLFAPWLFLACSGASMIYVAVVLLGTPCSIIGALVTGPTMRALGVSVGGR